MIELIEQEEKVLLFEGVFVLLGLWHELVSNRIATADVQSTNMSWT